MQAPKQVLKDEALYSGDNGRLFCGNCAGMNAKFTGRDLSGMKVERMKPSDAAEFLQVTGMAMTCESCGRGVE